MAKKKVLLAKVRNLIHNLKKSTGHNTFLCHEIDEAEIEILEMEKHMAALIDDYMAWKINWVLAQRKSGNRFIA